jgi:hypothetical protein
MGRAMASNLSWFEWSGMNNGSGLPIVATKLRGKQAAMYSVTSMHIIGLAQNASTYVPRWQPENRPFVVQMSAATSV